MLSLRMGLAYINSEAAKKAIPRVAELMAQHLGWSKKEKSRQIKLAEDYLGQLGGPFRNDKDLKTAFSEIDTNGKGRISELEFVEWWNKATPASKRLQKQLSLTAAGEVALEKTLFEDKEKK